MNSSSLIASDARTATPGTGWPRVTALGRRALANEWAVSALIFVCTRLFALAGGYFGAARLVRENPEYNSGWLAEMSLMWDAGHYATIAKDFYSYDPASPAGSNVAFAPLYPFLVNLFSGAVRLLSFGWDWGNSDYGALIVAGMLISNASFVVALALLVRWLRPRLGNGGAAMVALALASVPTAFFFSAIYTESLFLALVLGAFSIARSNWRWKWLCVGLLGLLAALTRFAGVILLPALAVDYLSQTGWRWRKVRPDILWLGLVPAGVGLYLGFLWWRFGDPLAMNRSMEQGWQHTTSFFLDTYWKSVVDLWKSLTGGFPPDMDPVAYYGHGSRLYLMLDLGLPLLLLIGTFLARRKLLASEWTWLALGIIYPLSFNITFSMARYVLPLWPGLVWLGTLRGRPRWLALGAVGSSLLLMAWCAGKYASARWIG